MQMIQGVYSSTYGLHCDTAWKKKTEEPLSFLFSPVPSFPLERKLREGSFVSRKFAWLSCDGYCTSSVTNSVFTFDWKRHCTVGSSSVANQPFVMSQFIHSTMSNDSKFSYIAVTSVSFLAFRVFYHLVKAKISLPSGHSPSKEWLYRNTLISFLHACVSSVWSIYWWV